MRRPPEFHLPDIPHPEPTATRSDAAFPTRITAQARGSPSVPNPYSRQARPASDA